MNPNDVLDLLGAMATGQGSNGKSFTDLLRERRQFVQGGEDSLKNQVQGDLANGVNGAMISPASANKGLLDYYTTNENATNGMVQQQTDLIKTLASLALQQQQHNQDIGLKNKELNLQYGLDDGGTGTGVSGVDAVAKVAQQGGKDILDQAPDDVTRRKLAQQVIAAGGVGAYRKKNPSVIPPAEQDQINTTNTTLNQINRITKQLNSSKALQDTFDNPVKNLSVKLAIATGNQRFLKNLGLSDDDVQALSDLTALSAGGERNLIGGRLSGYLSQMTKTALPGLDKNTSQNKKGVSALQKNLMDALNGYAKQKGYSAYTDIPGISLDAQPSAGAKLHVQIGNQTGYIDPAEFDPATMKKL